MNMVSVTFNEAAGKTVSPGETFWSDPVNVNIPDGNFLVWEWTLTGENIPCINMSDLTPCYADGVYTNEIPLPAMFGCNREVKKLLPHLEILLLKAVRQHLIHINSGRRILR